MRSLHFYILQINTCSRLHLERDNKIPVLFSPFLDSESNPKFYFKKDNCVQMLMNDLVLHSKMKSLDELDYYAEISLHFELDQLGWFSNTAF